MFSIDQFLAPPPLSVIFSIFLIAGLDLLGMLLLQKINFLDYTNLRWIKWQAPIIGAMLLAIFLYPLALAQLTSKLFMQVIAIFFIILGILHTFRKINTFNISKNKINKYLAEALRWPFAKKLLVFILFGMCLLALGPATSADSLDYHLGFAIAILNNGGIPIIPEWFSSRLSGSGEVLNAFALSLGAEQFGSLLQYVSLLSIVSIIYFSSNINNKINNQNKFNVSNLITLAALSAPVILILISSAKPQMWPIAMITLAFALIIHPACRKLSRLNVLISYSLICLLTMSAMQAKFNYTLEGMILLLFAFLLMIKRRFFWISLYITLFTTFLVILPPIIWKAAAFSTDWFDVLIHPLPGKLPGTDIFLNNAINSKLSIDSNSHFIFPFSVLFPDSIGSFGSVLGMGWLVLIGFKLEKDLWLWSGILLISSWLSVIVLFAPISARLYMTSYFCLLFILALQPNKNLGSYYNFLKLPIYSQALITSLAIWFGVLLVLPGALLPSWRMHVMEKSADGYEIMKWADTILPKNAIFLNGHRSMAFSPREAVSSDWLNFIDVKSDESKLYLNRLKEKKVSHVLNIGPINNTRQLANCYGSILAGPGIGHIATRNPFNSKLEYEAWILEFRSDKLPACAGKFSK